jgi:hypothetical protein
MADHKAPEIILGRLLADRELIVRSQARLATEMAESVAEEAVLRELITRSAGPGGSADLEVIGSRPVVVVRLAGAPADGPAMHLTPDEAQVMLDDLEATESSDPLVDDLRDVLAIHVGECQFWSPCAEPAFDGEFCERHLLDGER